MYDLCQSDDRGTTKYNFACAAKFCELAHRQIQNGAADDFDDLRDDRVAERFEAINAARDSVGHAIDPILPATGMPRRRAVACKKS